MRKAKAAVAVADEGPSKAWLDSYADAMTLLLAFFVLLYAFSLLDEKKFAELDETSAPNRSTEDDAQKLM